MGFGKKNETAKSHKLGFGKLLAWNSSGIASAACFIIVNGYLSKFCTDYLGMAPAAVATILLLSNVIDAITDLIACYVVDNSKVTKWGKARPYELGILGVWICTILMFHIPEGWSNALKNVWLFFTYTFAFGVFDTLRNAAAQPYTVRAFGGDRVLIGKISAYGGLVTMTGSVIVSLSFPVMMASMAATASGWRRLILLYGVPMLLLGLPRFLFVKEDPAIDAGVQHDKVHLKDIFKMLASNKYIWFYAVVMLCFNLTTNLGATAYYFDYVVHNPAIQGIFSALAIMILPLMLFMPPLLKKFSAPQLIGATAVLAAGGYLLNFFAGDNMGLLCAAALMTALATLPLSYLSGLIIFDLCNYNEYLDLPRMDATTTVVSNNFASQIGQGLGGAMTGFLLHLSGYVSSTGETAVQQPETVLFTIRYLYSLIPMVIMLLLAFFAFKLSKLNKQLPEIERTLAERKER